MLGGTRLALLVRLRKWLLLALGGGTLPSGAVTVSQRVSCSVFLWSMTTLRMREEPLLEQAPEFLLLGGELRSRLNEPRARGTLDSPAERFRRGWVGPSLVAGFRLLEVRRMIAPGEIFPQEFCGNREYFCEGVTGESGRWA